MYAAICWKFCLNKDDVGPRHPYKRNYHEAGMHPTEMIFNAHFNMQHDRSLIFVLRLALYNYFSAVSAVSESHLLQIPADHFILLQIHGVVLSLRSDPSVDTAYPVHFPASPPTLLQSQPPAH